MRLPSLLKGGETVILNTPGRRPTNLKEVMAYIHMLEEQLSYVLSNIDGKNITKGTVGTEQLAAGSVTTNTIAKGAVNQESMGEQVVTADKLTSEALQEIATKIIASNALAAKIRNVLEQEDIPYSQLTDPNGDDLMTLSDGKITIPLLGITADNLGAEVNQALAEEIPASTFFARADVIAAVQAIVNGGET